MRAPPHVEQDDSHRKGTGGIGGIVSLLSHRHLIILSAFSTHSADPSYSHHPMLSRADFIQLGTSDKDFTSNPDRRGKGAYHDSDGLFKTNTDGPSGHTALTGREGDLEKNPVAQSQSRQEGQGQHNAHANGEKPGLVEKIKHAIKKD